jgi:hypothetical protein
MSVSAGKEQLEAWLNRSNREFRQPNQHNPSCSFEDVGVSCSIFYAVEVYETEGQATGVRI